MAVLSILEEPFYPISGLSQPIQLLFLIAFFPSCLFASKAPSLFLKGHQLSTKSLFGPIRPWPSASAADAWCVCMSVCAHVNKAIRGDIVCTELKGRSSFFFFFFFSPFAEHLKEAAESWLAQNESMEDGEAVRRIPAFTPTIIQGSADNYTDSTHLHLHMTDFICSQQGMFFCATLMKQ